MVDERLARFAQSQQITVLPVQAPPTHPQHQNVQDLSLEAKYLGILESITLLPSRVTKGPYKGRNVVALH